MPRHHRPDPGRQTRANRARTTGASTSSTASASTRPSCTRTSPPGSASARSAATSTASPAPASTASPRTRAGSPATASRCAAWVGVTPGARTRRRAPARSRRRSAPSRCAPLKLQREQRAPIPCQDQPVGPVPGPRHGEQATDPTGAERLQPHGAGGHAHRGAGPQPPLQQPVHHRLGRGGSRSASSPAEASSRPAGSSTDRGPVRPGPHREQPLEAPAAGRRRGEGAVLGDRLLQPGPLGRGARGEDRLGDGDERHVVRHRQQRHPVLPGRRPPSPRAPPGRAAPSRAPPRVRRRRAPAASATQARWPPTSPATWSPTVISSSPPCSQARGRASSVTWAASMTRSWPIPAVASTRCRSGSASSWPTVRVTTAPWTSCPDGGGRLYVASMVPRPGRPYRRAIRPRRPRMPHPSPRPLDESAALEALDRLVRRVLPHRHPAYSGSWRPTPRSCSTASRRSCRAARPTAPSGAPGWPRAGGSWRARAATGRSSCWAPSPSSPTGCARLSAPPRVSVQLDERESVVLARGDDGRRPGRPRAPVPTPPETQEPPA